MRAPFSLLCSLSKRAREVSVSCQRHEERLRGEKNRRKHQADDDEASDVPAITTDHRLSSGHRWLTFLTSQKRINYDCHRAIEPARRHYLLITALPKVSTSRGSSSFGYSLQNWRPTAPKAALRSKRQCSPVARRPSLVRPVCQPEQARYCVRSHSASIHLDLVLISDARINSPLLLKSNYRIN